MLRDKSLIPLSRQHQHALALCVRINRAQPLSAEELEPWRAEITRLFEREIRVHFQAEEEVLFARARNFPELAPLVGELVAEHELLRRDFAKAENGSMSGSELQHAATQLSRHIRKEERQLFEGLQRLMQTEEMAELGTALESALQDAIQACALAGVPAQSSAEKG